MTAPGSPSPPLDLDSRSLLESVAEVLLVVGDDGVIRWASESIRQLGLDPVQVTGKRLVDCVHPDDRALLARMFLATVTGMVNGPGQRVVRVEAATELMPASGTARPVRYLEIRLDDRSGQSGIAGIVVHAWDVTEAVRRHAQVERLALHDPLTGLANRVLFADRLALELRRQQRGHGQLAVIYADVDGLKHINDRFGHSTGDAVLATVAARISSSLRPADTAARLSGDEFAIVCPDIASPQVAQQIALRLSAAVRQPIEVRDSSLQVSVSVGVAMATEHDTADDGARLLDRADAEMYTAKQVNSQRR